MLTSATPYEKQTNTELSNVILGGGDGIRINKYRIIGSKDKSIIGNIYCALDSFFYIVVGLVPDIGIPP